MMQQLLANKGVCLSVQTVRKYMNVELGLKSITRKPKYRYCKGPEAFGTFENLLKQDFHAEKRNSRWCIDFTYLFLANHSKRYNCTIIDLYDRRVVASVNSSRINTQLAIDTVSKALTRIGGESGMILHSDRGSQFTSKEFIEFCKDYKITQSMSKPGCPYDNAPMESLNGIIKTEALYCRFGKTRVKEKRVSIYEILEAVTDFIPYYNNERPKASNGGLSPVQFRLQNPMGTYLITIDKKGN